MIYRSSQDPRYSVPRAAAAVLTLLAGATMLALASTRVGAVSPILGRFWLAVLLAGAFGLLAGAAHLASLLWVRYELTDFELVLSRGVRRTRIPIECIEGALPVHPALDAPRPQPPHVTVVYQRAGRPGVAVLTPEDPERFLRDLAAGAPFLEKVGDRLLRKPGLLIPR